MPDIEGYIALDKTLGTNAWTNPAFKLEHKTVSGNQLVNFDHHNQRCTLYISMDKQNLELQIQNCLEKAGTDIDMW